MNMSIKNNILTKEDYWVGYAAATEALAKLTEIVQLYAQHRDGRCNEEQGTCECGLNTFMVIGEARIEEYKIRLQRLTRSRTADYEEEVMVVPKYKGKKNEPH